MQRFQSQRAVLPSSAGGGVAEGRGGVVKKFWTTPPRLHELMRLRDFSGIARPNPYGPPPAEEGSLEPLPRLGLRSNLIRNLDTCAHR